MNIIFSHGKESGPWGTKIRRLAEMAKGRGLTVDSLDYSDLSDPDARVEHLVEAARREEDKELLLAGSSMGAYVALVASGRVPARGVFLLAPALYLEGYGVQDFPVGHTHVEIVHGWSDELIPYANSMRYANAADCPLHLIPGDHRLTDSLDAVQALFGTFLSACL